MRYKLSIILLTIFISCADLFSQPWSSIGPQGGWTDHIAFHPKQTSIMYASGDTHGSFYKSVDSGNTWENLSSYGSYNAWCFEINPTRPDTIYAGSMMNEADSVGIRLSIDGGISWQTVLKWPAISQIAVSPSNPDIVYAAAGYWPGYQTDQHGEGIWKSTDGGFTWNKIITNSIDNMSIQTIAFNPSSPNAMYAGAYGVFGNGNGLYASLNGGTSWYLAGLANKHIWKIAVCNSTPNIIFAAAQDSVYKSSDYGTTWNAMNINIGVTEGLFFGLNISKSDNNIIYVGSLDKGIFKSTDAGLTWSGLMNSGLTSTRIWDVTVHPTNSNIVFAGQQGQGIWKSTDGASTWQDANTGFKCHYITDLHHTNGGVFAALYNEQGNNFASVRKWNGTSWNSIGLNDLWINKIVPVPGSTDTLFASKVDYGFFSGKPNNKLLKSTNSGLTWIPVGKGLDTTVEISTIKINHQNKNIIYAGNKLGIYKSANGGNDVTLLGLNNVTSISIHPVSTNIIYAGTWSGVYKSIDAGVNWTPLNTFSNAILSLAILSSNPKIIFAGSFANGILKSIDDGVTWNYVSTNLNGKTIFAILPDFFNPNIVYAGGTMGVYRSVSQGNNNTWQDFSVGLDSNKDKITCIEADSLGNIYAGTLGYGAYITNIVSSTKMDNNWKNENDFRIFPNPVNSILNIESPNKQLNKILIYDLLGNKAEEMSYSNQINISNLPNGVYFLNIYANNDLIAIKKIVVCTN